MEHNALQPTFGRQLNLRWFDTLVLSMPQAEHSELAWSVCDMEYSSLSGTNGTLFLGHANNLSNPL